MNNGQELFRQQVIDELNTKLNGEILLKPSISFSRFLLYAGLWLVLMTAVYHIIEINSAKTIRGELVFQGENNLVAKFMLPVDLAPQIKLGEIISVQLLGVSEAQHLSTTIKITHIDQSLSVLGASYLGDARVANLKVEATLMDSTVLIQKQKFSLSEGVAFSFRLNDQPQKLFPWLRKYFIGGA